MAITNTPRFGLPQASAGTDAWPGRPGFNQIWQKFEDGAAVMGQGTTAGRPTAGVPRRLYWATDTQRMWTDTGSAWVEVSPVGGGGTPLAGTWDGAEGIARESARADHRHPTESIIAHGTSSNTVSLTSAGGFKPLPLTSTDFTVRDTSVFSADSLSLFALRDGLYLCHVSVAYSGATGGRRSVGMSGSTGVSPVVAATATDAPNNAELFYQRQTIPVFIGPNMYAGYGGSRLLLWAATDVSVTALSYRLTVEYRG